MALLLAVASAPVAHAQLLHLPPRPGDAPGGSEIARGIADLDLESREERIFAEIARGNVPGWLRVLRPVTVTGEAQGRGHQVTFWVAPDYLAVGSDSDFLLVPLSPQTAQRVADMVGASLPTPRMVDAIWSAAVVRLEPAPIPPSPEMTTVPVFQEHNRIVLDQRRLHAQPLGALVAGHKKDVVLTAKLPRPSDRVAIYGWHKLNGEPIQPLYTGHTHRWVDYSHGIRLVLREIVLDGRKHDLWELLRNDALAPLLSDEGVILEPRHGAGVREPKRGEAHPSPAPLPSLSYGTPARAAPSSPPRRFRTIPSSPEAWETPRSPRRLRTAPPCPSPGHS
jgi:hypothetical protein